MSGFIILYSEDPYTKLCSELFNIKDYSYCGWFTDGLYHLYPTHNYQHVSWIKETYTEGEIVSYAHFTRVKLFQIRKQYNEIFNNSLKELSSPSTELEGYRKYFDKQAISTIDLVQKIIEKMGGTDLKDRGLFKHIRQLRQSIIVIQENLSMKMDKSIDLLLEEYKARIKKYGTINFNKDVLGKDEVKSRKKFNLGIFKEESYELSVISTDKLREILRYIDLYGDDKELCGYKNEILLELSIRTD